MKCITDWGAQRTRTYSLIALKPDVGDTHVGRTETFLLRSARGTVAHEALSGSFRWQSLACLGFWLLSSSLGPHLHDFTRPALCMHDCVWNSPFSKDTDYILMTRSTLLWCDLIVTNYITKTLFPNELRF